MARGGSGAAAVRARVEPVRGRAAPRRRHRQRRRLDRPRAESRHGLVFRCRARRRTCGDDRDRRRLFRDTAPARVCPRHARGRRGRGRPGGTRGRERGRGHDLTARPPRRAPLGRGARLRRSADAAPTSRARRCGARAGSAFRSSGACAASACACTSPTGPAARAGGGSGARSVPAARSSAHTGGPGGAGVECAGGRTRGAGRSRARAPARRRGADGGSVRRERRAADRGRRLATATCQVVPSRDDERCRRALAGGRRRALAQACVPRLGAALVCRSTSGGDDAGRPCAGAEGSRAPGSGRPAIDSRRWASAAAAGAPAVGRAGARSHASNRRSGRRDRARRGER